MPTTPDITTRARFERQLLRLKEALGVVTDQDVAIALGLSKAALSERKRRGAFPSLKLLALIGKFPELKLNYQYIVDGSASETTPTKTHGVLPVVKGGDRFAQIVASAIRSWEGRVGEYEALPLARTLTEGFTEDELKHTVAILLNEINRFGRRP